MSLPASLSNVNGNPFSTCLALEKLDLAEDNRYLRMDNGALYSIADERLICVPARCQEVSLSVAPGTKAISDGALGECMNLTEVTLPDGLTRQYLEYAYDHEMTVDQGTEPEEPGEPDPEP